MARKIAPSFIALAGLAIVLGGVAITLGYAAFERKLGDLTPAQIDSAGAAYAADLVEPLCKFADAMAAYSSTNDVERFQSAMQAIRPESEKAVSAMVDYAQAVRRKVEHRHDAESYATVRQIEIIWQAAHETDSVIASAAISADEWRKESPETANVSDWPKLAIQAEALIIRLGGDRDRATCAKSVASAEVIRLISYDRRDAEGHLHAMLEDYHTHAAFLARELSQDPNTTEAERQAAAEDLKIRQAAYRTNFESPTRQAAIRLFGVVPN